MNQTGNPIILYTDENAYEDKDIISSFIYENTKSSSPVPKNVLEDESINSKYVHYVEMDSIYMPCAKTVKDLPTGVYNVGMSNNGVPLFSKTELRSDEWIDVHSELISELLDEIETFWKNGDIFKKNGLLHRRGILFHGPAGTGKTVICKQLMSSLLKEDGIVFICSSPSALSKGISVFRKMAPKRKIICIFEDIDSIFSTYGEHDLLSFLDGEDTNEYLLNIATTNYPENLNARIIARPRRFDQIIYVGNPDERIRKEYFIHKGIAENEIDFWVKHTNGFSYSAMAELVVSVKCLNVDFNKAVERIKILLKGNINSNKYETMSDDESTMGFGA